MFGINGISMQALAYLLYCDKVEVVGHDKKNNKLTFAKVFKKFNKNEVKNSNFVVVSSAFSMDDEDILYVNSLNIPILKRGELLAIIAGKYESVIAVAGTHGKSTTTALVYHVLLAANQKPTLHIGAYLTSGVNVVLSGHKFFITEACEYKDNFLYLKPTYSIITNIEPEHLDYFHSYENELKSFNQFKLQSDYCIDNLNGVNSENIIYKNHKLSFDIVTNKGRLRIKMRAVPRAIIEDVLFAYKLCKLLNYNDDVFCKAMSEFKGIKARFQYVKTHYGKCIIDYAHHPKEIEKTIQGAKEIFKNKKICVIFQPHTYSRTAQFFNDFIKSLSEADMLILYKTFPARETLKDGKSEKDLYEGVKNITKRKSVFHIKSLSKLINVLDQKQIFEKYVVIFMGAGDLCEKLKKYNFWMKNDEI